MWTAAWEKGERGIGKVGRSGRGEFNMCIGPEGEVGKGFRGSGEKGEKVFVTYVLFVVVVTVVVDVVPGKSLVHEFVWFVYGCRVCVSVCVCICVHERHYVYKLTALISNPHGQNRQSYSICLSFHLSVCLFPHPPTRQNRPSHLLSQARRGTRKNKPQSKGVVLI